MIDWQRLPEAFPRLRDALTPRARLHPVLQQHAADCGPACLVMVARWLGVDTDVAALRTAGLVSAHGWRAQDFGHAAGRLGLRTRALRVHDIDELASVGRPVVLHWRFSHFVVLASLDAHGARILDPAIGELFVTRAELDACFTGVVIWIEQAEPAADPLPAPAPRAAPWRLVVRLVRAAGLGPQLLLAAASLQVLALAPALFASLLFARVAPAGDRTWLLPLVVAAMGIAAAQCFVALLKTQLAVLLRARLMLLLGSEMVRRLLGAPLAAAQPFGQGDLLARFGSAEQFREGFCNLGLAAVLDVLLIAIALPALLLAFPPAAGACICVLLLWLAIVALARRRREALLRRHYIATAQWTGYSAQLIGGLETLRAGGVHDWANDSWSRIAAQRATAEVRLGSFEAALAVAGQCLGLLGPMLLGVMLVSAILDGRIGVGAGLAAYGVAVTLFGSLMRMVETWLHLQRALFQGERAADILELPQRTEIPEAPLDRAPRVDVAGLSFRHAANAPWSLQSVDLAIAPGSFVVVAGASGSGKSTLLGLLGGLLDAPAGTVRLDGRDRDLIDRARSRRPCVMVPQFPYLFAGTLRDNIAMFRPDASDEQVAEAARLAVVDRDIEALPMRYDAILGEGGTGLSGGQRQRIALARALLAEPGLLILDEATSALDPATERQVLENLAALRCTRILATHRLGLADLADQVVVLDAGRVVEQGPAAHLRAAAGAFVALSAGRGTHEGQDQQEGELQCAS